MKKILLIIIVLVVLIAGYMGASYAMQRSFFVGWSHSHAVYYKYYCSDVCPSNGRWFKTYYPIPPQEECASLSGEAVIDPAFRAYIGCAPR